MNNFSSRQPAPQFGSGNNKFLNNNFQQPAVGVFDPKAVSLSGYNSGQGKTFANFGSGDTNIFQNNNNK